MSRLVLRKDEKTGEPVKKELKSAEKIKQGEYVSIPAIENVKETQIDR